MSGLIGDQDALAAALDAGIREWENGGGELLPILHRHASVAVANAATLADDLRDMGDVWGGDAIWITTGTKVADLMAETVAAALAERSQP